MQTLKCKHFNFVLILLLGAQRYISVIQNSLAFPNMLVEDHSAYRSTRRFSVDLLQKTLDQLGYKADSHRPNLTGSLAVSFTLPDETEKPIELYEIEAPFTLLIFYRPCV